MGNYPSLTPKEIEAIILKLDYIFIRQKGSHRIYKKDNKLLVIPFHSKVLKSGA